MTNEERGLGEQQHDVDAPRTPATDAPSLGAHYEVFFKALERGAQVADRRTSDVFFAFAGVLIATSLFLRLRPLGLQVSDLRSEEFIAILLISSGLLLVGTILRIIASRAADAALEYHTTITKELVEADTRITESMIGRLGERGDRELDELRKRVEERVRDRNLAG